MRWIALPLLVVFAAGCGSRADAPGLAAASATASTAASLTATATAAPTPSASPTPKPNPTAGPGTYVSLPYGFQVDLPGGWRRSACQSTRDPQQPPGVETFTSASVEAETGSDMGSAQDVVVVRVEPNTDGVTALGWLESGKMGSSIDTRFEQISFDGNPDAARIVTKDGTTTIAYVVNARFRIYAVSRGYREPSSAAAPAGAALMRSLHILRDAELKFAHATLASPAPLPPRTAEDVADALARGFTQKDTGILATVADACLTTGNENAGAAFRATVTMLAEMQAAFAKGLVVTVQPRPIDFVGSPGLGATVRATWQDAGQPARNVKLMLNRVRDTWYWIGVLYVR